MMHFTISDDQIEASGCVKCCCEKLNLRPGTISRVSINYVGWAASIGKLHCLPSFSLEQMETCPVPGGSNLPPQPQADIKFTAVVNVQLVGDLNTKVTEPEATPLTFRVLPLYGPRFGKLTLDADGTFVYNATAGYTGEDRFYASVSDGINSPVVFEVILAIGIDGDTLSHTPHVSIDLAGVTVDRRYFTVYFPVRVSPAAQLCEVWRLTVHQGALDCDCTCYSRIDCFDIGIAKC